MFVYYKPLVFFQSSFHPKCRRIAASHAWRVVLPNGTICWVMPSTSTGPQMERCLENPRRTWRFSMVGIAKQAGLRLCPVPQQSGWIKDELWGDSLLCFFLFNFCLVMVQRFRTIQHLQKKQSQTVEEQGSCWHSCSGNVDVYLLLSHETNMFGIKYWNNLDSLRSSQKYSVLHSYIFVLVCIYTRS